MNEIKDVGRRLKEACLSGSVATLEALIEDDELILDRVSSLSGFYSDSPLHVAALRGHLDFTKALLCRKPKLATELDLQRRSPLHVASAEGHVEIVRELVHGNLFPHLCFARDQDGRIPLHLAAIKGRVEVIQELLRAEQDSIHEKLDRGETVLHLCVKYNKLEALQALVQYLQSNDKELRMEILLNSEDHDGNTILHFAAALKQIDTIKYLLEIKSVKDRANVKNQNCFTALDIVEHCPVRDLKTMEIKELLLQAGVHKSFYMRPDSSPGSPPDNPPTPPQPWCKARDWIYMFWKKYFKFDHGWLQQVRGHLITAATLTATVAYDSIMSPPGGFWQDSDNGHTAGEAILDSSHSPYFARYLVINTAMLIASCITIMLALTGFPIHNKFLIWVLVFTVYITLSCMVGAYVLAIIVVTPNVEDDFKLSLKISVGLELCWMGICGFVAVLHAFHFSVWLRNKFRNLVTIYRSHKCMGNFC
ncbi:ankyrin repeat-containing protein At2g01680-like [Rhododendron vialii]|uniref:ankyrin repeat-containing protein At2g01680-like n=1 Tax=Rhododendron vialii TaxID=182163 RepID=UPI00265F3613|nr:ankyrin repeat-containing protein At2g01680-like [Rhododendron vialii]